jgi:chemotaxis protein MotA
MFAIIGIVVVLGAIVGGYLMEHGVLLVLVQPAELVIIGGAALGTILIANPLSTIKGIIGGLIGVLAGSRFSKPFYLETLTMLMNIFNQARKQGLAKLESDLDEPDKSELFRKYPKLLKDHHALAFICDTLRMHVTGGVDHFDLDQMMDADIEIHHHQVAAPATALSTTADALPGLGIVAAVLGVVITMGAIGGPPEEIGHKVAAALVGTFLGILLCYGFLGPLASNMSKLSDGESEYYRVLRVGLLAFIKGSAPIMSVEFARRAIPGEARPSFKEMETACRGGGSAAQAA